MSRRADLHIVVENLADPFNVQSVCRSAEALGVQHVHVIESVCEFRLPAAEAHATSRGALGRSDGGEGAARWLSGDSRSIIPAKKAPSASETPNSLVAPNAMQSAIASTVSRNSSREPVCAM